MNVAVTTDEATIQWVTAAPANSQIKYGVNGNYGRRKAFTAEGAGDAGVLNHKLLRARSRVRASAPDPSPRLPHNAKTGRCGAPNTRRFRDYAFFWMERCAGSFDCVRLAPHFAQDDKSKMRRSVRGIAREKQVLRFAQDDN